MSSVPTSLAYELFRPTLARYSPMMIVILLASFLWVMAGDSSRSDFKPSDLDAGIVDAPVEMIRTGNLNVPVYYFPDSATQADRYVTAIDSDC